MPNGTSQHSYLDPSKQAAEGIAPHIHRLLDVEEAGAARSNLPATGASHGGLVALGGAAVGLGLVLTVTGRRRRTTA